MTHTKTLQEADLRQFTGTEHWYRHPLARKVQIQSNVCYSKLALSHHDVPRKAARSRLLAHYLSIFWCVSLRRPQSV
jgi:hypothetical protein